MDVQTKFVALDCEQCDRWMAEASKGRAFSNAELVAWVRHLMGHVGQMVELFARLMQALDSE